MTKPFSTIDSEQLSAVAGGKCNRDRRRYAGPYYGQAYARAFAGGGRASASAGYLGFSSPRWGRWDSSPRWRR